MELHFSLTQASDSSIRYECVCICNAGVAKTGRLTTLQTDVLDLFPASMGIEAGAQQQGLHRFQAGNVSSFQSLSSVYKMGRKMMSAIRCESRRGLSFPQRHAAA